MIDFDKEIWEGWRVKDYIEALQPILDMIMNKQAIRKPFESKKEMVEFIVNNQPYYKKSIPEVNKYFAKKYHLK